MPVVILGRETAPSGHGDDLPAAYAAVEPRIGCGLVRIVDGVKGRAAIVVRMVARTLLTTLRRRGGWLQLRVRLMGGHSLAMVQIAGDDIPAIFGVVAGAFA